MVLYMLDPEYMIHMAMGIELAPEDQPPGAYVPIKVLNLFRGIEGRVNNQALTLFVTDNVGIDLEGVVYKCMQT
jgi:hypothetical protein